MQVTSTSSNGDSNNLTTMKYDQLPQRRVQKLATKLLFRIMNFQK